MAIRKIVGKREEKIDIRGIMKKKWTNLSEYLNLVGGIRKESKMIWKS